MNTFSMNKFSFRISADGSGSGDNKILKIRNIGRNGLRNFQSILLNHHFYMKLKTLNLS